MKEPKTLFGKRLREARQRKGLSQKKLGILAGIDEFAASARVNQYEVGTHTPPYEMAQKLAAVLNVPTPFLFADDDLMAEIILRVGELGITARRRLLRDTRD